MSDKKIPIESQKDMLFSKLLPAINNNPFSTTYATQTEENTPLPKAKIEELEIPTENDALENLHSRLFARQNSSFRKNYATINIMENAVSKNIDQVILRFNACSCDRCKCDIAAQALNNLPPKYVVTSPESMVKYEEEIENKAVMTALVNAVLKIRSKPRH